MRLHHPPNTGLAAGLIALLWSESPDAAVLEDLAIRLHSGVGPHDMIHCRCDKNRRLGCKTQRGQQIRRRTRRKPGHELSRCWRYQYEVRPPCQFDVAHRGLGFGVPQTLADGLAGHGLQGGFRHELGG